MYDRASAIAAANEQADSAFQARNNSATAAIPDKGWVRGPSVPVMAPPQCIVGLDPGAKAVFTAVVHSAVAEQTLSVVQPGTDL